MRAAVNAFALLCAAAALAVAPSGGAAEEEASDAQGTGQRTRQDGADRWVPSLSVISGVTSQDWSGALESEFCNGCSLPSPMSQPLREPATGGDRDVTPYVGGSLEFMTPELPIPTSPRFFVGGEIVATFGFERRVAREGAPGEISSPFPEATSNLQFGESGAQGQGAETIAQLASPFYGAYLGVAFPFELYGRQLRLKPSFAWIHYDINVQGVLSSAQCLPEPNPIPGDVDPTLCNTVTTAAGVSEGFLREVRLGDSSTGTFDGIGPGIDLEVDTGVLGPVGTSLYLGGRFYRILGERTVELADLASYDDRLGTGQAGARWSFEVDPWMYRLVVGMRFQWLGFPD